MKTDIRKISVGSNYPNGAMHYQVGQRKEIEGVKYVISQFALNQEYQREGKIAFDVVLSNSNGSVIWKTLVDMPMAIENDLSFD